jgi:hypothetical protein
MEPPLLTFAIDISRGDPAVAVMVRQWLALPPMTNEAIGFYGDPDTMPREWRQWLATVSLLRDRGYIDGFEDKYSNEILAVWDRDGLLDRNALPADAQAVWEIIENGFDYDGADDNAPEPAQLETLWRDYAAASRAVEDAIMARGRVLVSIDATDGDTLFFAAVDPVVADRWLGVGFAVIEDGGVRREVGVRPPMWGRLWAHLLYAMEDVPEEFEERGLPPGLAEPGPLRF